MTVFHCSTCGRAYVNRPMYCRCGGQEFGTKEIPGNGRIYSHTTLYAAAEPFEKDLPFQIAIVDLEGGPRLTARIAGPPVGVGDGVRLVEERDGVHYFSAA